MLPRFFAHQVPTEFSGETAMVDLRPLAALVVSAIVTSVALRPQLQLDDGPPIEKAPYRLADTSHVQSLEDLVKPTPPAPPGASHEIWVTVTCTVLLWAAIPLTASVVPEGVPRPS